MTALDNGLPYVFTSASIRAAIGVASFQSSISLSARAIARSTDSLKPFNSPEASEFKDSILLVSKRFP